MVAAVLGGIVGQLGCDMGTCGRRLARGVNAPPSCHSPSSSLTWTWASWQNSGVQPVSTQSIKKEPIHSSLSKNTHVQLGSVMSFGVSPAPLEVQAMGRGHGQPCDWSPCWTSIGQWEGACGLGCRKWQVCDSQAIKVTGTETDFFPMKVEVYGFYRSNCFHRL